MADVPLLKIDPASAAGTVPTSDGAGGIAWQAPAGGAAKVGFRAHRSTTQSGVAAATFTKVLFATEDQDDGNDFDPITSIWTVPATGWYAVAASVGIDAASWADGNRVIVRLVVNGTEVVRLADVTAGADAGPVVGGGRPIYLTAGDVVTVEAWRTTAGGFTGNTVSTYFTAVNL